MVKTDRKGVITTNLLAIYHLTRKNKMVIILTQRVYTEKFYIHFDPDSQNRLLLKMEIFLVCIKTSH